MDIAYYFFVNFKGKIAIADADADADTYSQLYNILFYLFY
jgi:hypothetical protein